MWESGKEEVWGSRKGYVKGNTKNSEGFGFFEGRGGAGIRPHGAVTLNFLALGDDVRQGAANPAIL
jgi:hypothetical protein